MAKKKKKKRKKRKSSHSGAPSLQGDKDWIGLSDE